MIIHDKDNIQKTSQIVKEVIEKSKIVNNLIANQLILNNTDCFDLKTIANSFNEYFVNVRQNLASVSQTI